MAAFEAAIEANCAIELDVQITADNQLLVFHDETLQRLCGRLDRVIDLPFNELRTITYSNTQDTLPSLADVFALVHGRVPIIIEVKSDYRVIGQRPQAIIKALQTYSGHVAVMSFDPNIMLSLRRAKLACPLGLVSELFASKRWPQLSLWQRFAYRQMLSLKKLQPDFLGYRVDDLPHGPVSKFRANGGKVISWTVKSPEQLERAHAFADVPVFEGLSPSQVWQKHTSKTVPRPLANVAENHR